MPEPVQFARIAKAYLTSVNFDCRPKNLPDGPCCDTVQISREAREKSKEFLLKVKQGLSSAEKSSVARHGENDLEILNLSTNASRDQIHRAYLSAIKRYHPDNFTGFCPEFRKLAEEKSKQINLAYKKLTCNA